MVLFMKSKGEENLYNLLQSLKIGLCNREMLAYLRIVQLKLSRRGNKLLPMLAKDKNLKINLKM